MTASAPVDAPAADTSSTAVPAHRDPRIIAAANESIEQLRDLLPSLVVALCVTDDGFEIARTTATAYATADNHDDRLPSMASSMQALSEAVARELHLGDTRLSYIEADHGRVVFRRVPEHSIVLAAVVSDDESMGRATSMTRRAVDLFSAAL